MPEIFEKLEKYQQIFYVEPPAAKPSGYQFKTIPKTVYTFKDISDIIDLIDTDPSQRLQCLTEIRSINSNAFKFMDTWETCFTGVVDAIVRCLEDS
jgi:hypothetical protein